jgi:hypothetical protein
MSDTVRARRLHPDEGQCLLRLVRRGNQESIRVRRALIIMASASGTTVPAIARLVAADEDTVRDIIHAFNSEGLACLGPHWAGGRPSRITNADVMAIIATATTRPRRLGLPSPTGVCASWPPTCPAATSAPTPDGHRPGWCVSGGNGCARSCMSTASASSALVPGRSPTTRISRQSWTGSKR